LGKIGSWRLIEKKIRRFSRFAVRDSQDRRRMAQIERRLATIDEVREPLLLFAVSAARKANREKRTAF
jgi:hypothetical protein